MKIMLLKPGITKKMKYKRQSSVFPLMFFDLSTARPVLVIEVNFPRLSRRGHCNNQNQTNMKKQHLFQVASGLTIAAALALSACNKPADADKDAAKAANKVEEKKAEGAIDVEKAKAEADKEVKEAEVKADAKKAEANAEHKEEAADAAKDAAKDAPTPATPIIVPVPVPTPAADPATSTPVPATPATPGAP